VSAQGEVIRFRALRTPGFSNFNIIAAYNTTSSQKKSMKILSWLETKPAGLASVTYLLNNCFTRHIFHFALQYALTMYECNKYTMYFHRFHDSNEIDYLLKMGLQTS
jgi:hypothetical protein